MKNPVISINEDLCNGCGLCITSCTEGALALVNGKAKLVNEHFCDGLGHCIGVCPTGALKIETNLPDSEESSRCGCIHSASKKLPDKSDDGHQTSVPTPISQLSHWPVQIHLVNPHADFFKNRELVILSTCSPLAYANVHQQFIKNRSVVVGCPKLDDTSEYSQKLADIFIEAKIPKVIVVIMSVPCCKGLIRIVQQAQRTSGRKDLIIEEQIISLEGEIVSVREIQND